MILRQIERESFVYYAVIVVSSQNREPQKYMKEYTFGQRKHDESREQRERNTARRVLRPPFRFSHHLSLIGLISLRFSPILQNGIRGSRGPRGGAVYECRSFRPHPDEASARPGGRHGGAASQNQHQRWLREGALQRVSQEPRCRHRGPRARRLRRVHGGGDGGFPRRAQMCRLQLPPQLSPQGERRGRRLRRRCRPVLGFAPPPAPPSAAAVRGVLPDPDWVSSGGGAGTRYWDAGAAVDVRRRRDAEHSGGPGGRFEPECRRNGVQETVQNKVHAGAKGQNA